MSKHKSVATAVLIEEYIAGASLPDLAERYGYAGASGVYNRMQRAGFTAFRYSGVHSKQYSIRDQLLGALHMSYDRDEWGTPAPIVELARSFYSGLIDCDPASNDAAQKVIQAAVYYTKEQNGLLQPWIGNVWLNMPYSYPLVELFVLKLFKEIDAGNTEQALVLTNNSSETKWYRRLANKLAAGNTKQRIQFVHCDRDTGGNRQGQTLFYYGPDVIRFYKHFDPVIYAPMGTILAVVDYLKLEGVAITSKRLTDSTS